MNKKTSDIIKIASSTNINFGDDVLVFNYINNNGEQWEGCLEEWIGNDSNTEHLNDFEYNGIKYHCLGTSGGGSDLILVSNNDSPKIYYYNDYDLTISKIADNIPEFINKLSTPI